MSEGGGALRRPAALAALILSLTAASAAAAAGPAKPPAPAPLGTSPAVAAEVGGFGRTLPGAQRLLVTFSDTPSGAEARRRLAPLGTVAPVLPEAGVWGLSPTEPAQARERVLRRGDVGGAEWSLARQAAERPSPRPPGPLGPAPVFVDPLFTPAAQWGLLSGAASWAAELTTRTPRPRIAVLDSGVDSTHEEWTGPASPLVAPRSTIRGDDDASDQGASGHGTHVAGIAAAPANGVGVVGVAPAQAAAAEVIPVQIADREGRSTDETMIRGIRHAVNNGARVINISAGGPGYSQAFQDTILWAARHGALIVASVGNEGNDSNPINYPAAYRRVLGVGALCDAVASPECPVPYGVARFSNRNRSVDVIAPGVNILSSVPRRVTERVVRTGYALKDGTSMAAPYVTGLAALVMASNDGLLSPYQVLRHIENTAVDLPPGGRDDTTGSGVVNPRAAVTLTAPADDTDEVNDDVKWVRGVKRLKEAGRALTLEATADRVEDPDDVYRVRLARGERLRIVLTYGRGELDLYLWGPATRTVATGRENVSRNLIRYRGGASERKVVVYRAPRGGRHYVNVFARKGSADYTVTLVRGG
jgi:subtilisin family serine protease